MKYVPAGITRLTGRTALKISKHSPTILVVSGVVGFSATAFMAARASRNLNPILDQHQKERAELGQMVSKNVSKAQRKQQQTQILEMYYNTSLSLVKLYGPTIVVGTLSAASVLYGHKVLSRRQVATMAAYSGVVDQFSNYRDRVRKTLGDAAEKNIFDGAHGEYEEDPEHKGEYKLVSKFEQPQANYLRPWFDEANVHWSRDAQSNFFFLKGVQQHMNDLLRIRGHVFLQEVYDALRLERAGEAQVVGWLRDGDGDGFVDFGFLSGTDPHTVAFRNHAEKSVQFNFNVDPGIIWDKI